MMNLAGLSNMIPANLNFSGGFGLAGVLAMLFPYIQKIILHTFDFDLLAYVEEFFAQDTFLGKLFNGNSALGTGAGILSVGAIFALLQQFCNRLWMFYKDYFTIFLVIPKSDGSYWAMLKWVQERQLKNPKHQCLRTENKVTPAGKWESVREFIASLKSPDFTFKGKNIKINPEQENDNPIEFPGNEDSSDCLVLSTTRGDTNIFIDMLAEVKVFGDVLNHGRTSIYTTRNGKQWHNSGTGKRKRPLESVILDDGVVESVLTDIQDFIEAAEWYSEYGVPYRRGYLLHGPPGTGKTSFISAVAGHFNLNVCILNLSDQNLTDDSLNELLINAPERSLILLEDVDAAFGSRDASMDTEKPSHDSKALKKSLTFSGLLNALDGVSSAEGRILFMTTNHLEKLDSALIRPGRVDMRQFIGFASESQVERMFRRFYKDAPAETAQRFVKAVFDVPDRPVSLAKIQGLFLRYIKNPEGVFTGLSMLDEKDATATIRQASLCHEQQTMAVTKIGE